MCKKYNFFCANTKNEKKGNMVWEIKLFVVISEILLYDLKSMKKQEGKLMKKPVLVVMAAGMGSRYGGLKQIDPIDKEGHIIMDFSIYDAVRAGFEKVVFIIKKENEKAFREAIGERLSKQIEVAYVFQELDNLPEGYTVPEGKSKTMGNRSCRLKLY